MTPGSSSYVTISELLSIRLERVVSEPVEPPPEAKPVPATEVPIVEIVQTDKLALSVREASKLLGLGRHTIHTAVNEGKIPAVKFGRRTLIPTKGLREWLGALPNR